MAEQLKEHIKDPGSAITHFIGMLMAIFAAIPLLLKAAREPSKIYIIAIAVYAASLILLYAASTTYHTFDKSRKVNTILKKIDHMMIFVLIAGSYTPVCMLTLWEGIGKVLLALVWGIAAAGMILKLFWVYCPKWVSSVLYIGMGWVCILAAAPFAACGFFSYHSMTAEQLFWAWCKSELLSPKRLVYRYNSYYYDAIQGGMRMKKPKQKKRSRKERRH